MKILFIAPHPFYQDRGTPIDVHLAVTALSERGDVIDLLIYHEGIDREYRNVTIHRITPWFPIRNVKPGFSFRKILCDIFLFIKLVQMLRKSKYDVLHVTEESVFMALVLKPFFNLPYVYDIDSLMSRQLVDHFRFLKPFEGFLRWCESVALKHAIASAPVCNALAEEAEQLGAKKIELWKDVSLLGQFGQRKVEDLRVVYDINCPIIMYIGNFVYYQGVDLLLKSFARACMLKEMKLVIIGGNPVKRMKMYQTMAENLGCSANVIFLGQKKVEELDNYMKQANVLVSPRLYGHNTPMKIFSYMHSGIPVLATKLYTHTQEIPEDAACLAEPDQKSFAKALIELVENKDLRDSISKNAVDFIEREHTYQSLKNAVNRLYNDISMMIGV